MCLRTLESSYEWEKVLFQFELLFGRTKLHKDARRSVLLLGAYYYHYTALFTKLALCKS